MANRSGHLLLAVVAGASLRLRAPTASSQQLAANSQQPFSEQERAMQIVVLTDIHGNLPALEAALREIQRGGYDLLVHLGDVIGIGPYPAETLERLLAQPNIRCIMGNHDWWFVHGLPVTWDEHKRAHQEWIHQQLAPAMRAVVAQWPLTITEIFGGSTLTFTHYGLLSTPGDWQPIIPQATPVALDQLFCDYTTSLLCYGHHHPFSDLQGRARYINPGSLGCHTTAIARYTTITVAHNGCSVIHHRVPYDDTPLFEAFEKRQTPQRAFLYKAFFGGRFSA
ncbi:MAG: metallophosphoesterase family protein [Caldilineaceae bacterium]